MTTSTADTLVFGLDYPTDRGPLYSNVNFASGHCFHPAASVEAITLYLNGQYQDAAILGYPRLDVNQAYPAFEDRSLLSGFQCFFDSASLIRGENRLDFEITVNSCPTRVTRTITPSSDGTLQMSDVFIDIVGPCNLTCAMCPQGGLEGTQGDRGRGFMPCELFGRVLARLRAEGYVGESINLYNWGDPLLHPQLGRILDICDHNQYWAIVSTNLSFPEARIRTLTEHPVELLLVSVSGFSQETYGRNHIGGDFTLIRSNLERLRKSRGRIGTIVLKYLVFRYNREEIEWARAFADEVGFEFGAYLGAIPSAESFFRYGSDGAYRNAVDSYLVPESLAVRSARFCPQQSTVTINHRAELDRCCVSWGSDAPVSVFDADLRKHLEQKTASAFCGRCLSSGYSYYKHFGIFRPDLLKL